jgi:hypothetical protein
MHRASGSFVLHHEKEQPEMPTKNVSHSQIEECKDMVRDAQEKLIEAIESLEYAVRILPS